MKREYTIIIESKGVHQPSSNEIFKAVSKLVDDRVWEFPEKGRGGTHVTIVPQRNRPKPRPLRNS